MHLEPGEMSRAFTTVMEFFPTFIELDGIPPLPLTPSSGRDGRLITTFRGRAVHAVRGKL